MARKTHKHYDAVSPKDQAKRNLDSATRALELVGTDGMCPDPSVIVIAELINAARALGVELRRA